MKRLLGGFLAAAAVVLMSSSAFAEPKIVSGPAAEADCFAPWSTDTKFFQYEAK
jgi:ribose transport system substrate-binding protein